MLVVTFSGVTSGGIVTSGTMGWTWDRQYLSRRRKASDAGRRVEPKRPARRPNRARVPGRSGSRAAARPAPCMSCAAVASVGRSHFRLIRCIRRRSAGRCRAAGDEVTREPKAVVRTLVTNDSLMRLVMIELLPTPSGLSAYSEEEGTYRHRRGRCARGRGAASLSARRRVWFSQKGSGWRWWVGWSKKLSDPAG